MIYLDTSAAVKILIEERGTEDVFGLFARRDDLISSRLLSLELHSLAQRRGLDSADAQRIIDRMVMVSLDDDVVRRAIELRFRLRSLDAVHLATADRLAAILTGFVSYDSELNAAATELGIRVVTLPLQEL